MDLQVILTSTAVAIPVIVGILAEATKVIGEGLTQGRWSEGLFRSGGMPSTHAAFVTSLLIIVGLKTGIGSVEFAISFVFASLVWYDAVSSRRAIGKQAEVLNKLLHWERLTERLGHSTKEVLAGILFGAVMTGVGMWAEGAL